MIRLRPGLRPAAVAAGLAAAALAVPGPAGAHLRTGTVAVDYLAHVSPLRGRAASALDVRVYESDRALRLAVRPQHRALVLGYLGEPFLRLGPAGISVNEASPTAVAAGLVDKDDRVSGRVVWRTRGGSAVVWHDSRVQGLPAGAKRGTWRVPLVVDGARTELEGTIVRVPPPRLRLWAVLAGLVVAAAVALTRLRSRDTLRTAAVALGVAAGAASLVTAAAFALDAYASPGTWIAGADEAIFAAAGLAALAWGTPAVKAGGAAGLGFLGVVVGLTKVAVFAHGEVLSAIPATPSRIAAAVALAAGIAAATAGTRLLVAEASSLDLGARNSRLLAPGQRANRR